MSAEFTMSTNAHHPRLKTIFQHDDGQLSIVLGGEKYAHVSLITTYAEWRQLVRDVDQEMARQNAAQLWAVYDNHGDCAGVDVVAKNERDALSQFRYATVEWRAVVQDEATRVADRLEFLRGRLRAENISYGELAELQSLSDHIQPGDVELAEAAGIDEQEFATRGAEK